MLVGTRSFLIYIFLKILTCIFKNIFFFKKLLLFSDSLEKRTLKNA